MDFCPKSRLLLIARANSLTHLGPVWPTDLARVEVLFFFVVEKEYCVLRQNHAFRSPVPFVMKVAPEANHLRHQSRQRYLNEQKVYRLHPHQILVNELGTQIFDL